MKFIDFLFPPHCIICKKPSNKNALFYKYICSSCLKKIEINKKDYCLACKKEHPFGKTCKKCSKDFSLSGVIVLSSYKNPMLKEAIHCLKYKHIRSLSLPLAWLMKGRLGKFSWQDKKDWLIIPVPLAKKRQRKRGFNQAELLSRNLSFWLGIKNRSDIIERTKFNSPQTNIEDSIKRKENVKDSFVLKKDLGLAISENTKIMLIDDVLTTGATLNECAKVLSPYVKEVWACVIAH